CCTGLREEVHEGGPGGAEVRPHDALRVSAVHLRVHLVQQPNRAPYRLLVRTDGLLTDVLRVPVYGAVEACVSLLLAAGAGDVPAASVHDSLDCVRVTHRCSPVVSGRRRPTPVARSECDVEAGEA